MANAITDLLYEFNVRADITIEDIAELIGDIAVPVVRCKDCAFCRKWNEVWRSPIQNTLICILDDRHPVDVKATDFCSWGERREDD